MAQILDFNLSEDEYIGLAERKLNDGDAESAISYLKQAISLDDSAPRAYIDLGKIYSVLGEHQLSNTELYKALVSNPDEEQESRVFYMLANNFAEMGEMDVVSYYMRYFGDDFSLPEDVDGEEDKQEFYLVDKEDNDRCEAYMTHAYACMQTGKFDEAIDYAKKVNSNSKFYQSANHIILVAYMMKNDVDRVIEEAKMMLQKEDNLAVRSTLATAYLMEEKLAEAFAETDKILEKEYTRLEDILLILPLIVNLNMHVYVVKYTKIVLESLHFQPNTMMWLSQGLYNIGQKTEAIKVMNRIKNIFGDNSPADYYISLYNENPSQVEYCLNLPYNEKLARYKRIEEYMRKDNDELYALLHDGTEIARLIRWAFDDGNEKILLIMTGRLGFIRSPWIEKLYRELLICPNLQFETMSRMLTYLLNGGYHLDCCVVTQDRFKDVSFTLPDCYYQAPNVLKNALGYCVCDIMFTDEDPSTYLAILKELVDGFASFGDDGKIKWATKSAEKIAHLRSAKTIVGALISEVYIDEPDSMQDTIARYRLNKTTLNKYRKIMFGESDEE